MADRDRQRVGGVVRTSAAPRGGGSSSTMRLTWRLVGAAVAADGLLHGRRRVLGAFELRRGARHQERPARLADEERRARIRADERLLERHRIRVVLGDQLDDVVVDRLQPQCRRLARGGLPPAEVERRQTPALGVDDRVSARCGARIDAENLHVSRLGAVPDVPARIHPGLQTVGEAVVRIAFLSAVCAVALAAPGVAQAQLVATVSDPGVISLTQGGAPVTHLAPGTYTIEVHDLTQNHNFHLSGPGVDETTGISAEETPTWTVTLTARRLPLPVRRPPRFDVRQLHGRKRALRRQDRDRARDGDERSERDRLRRHVHGRVPGRRDGGADRDARARARPSPAGAAPARGRPRARSPLRAPSRSPPRSRLHSGPGPPPGTGPPAKVDQGLGRQGEGRAHRSRSSSTSPARSRCRRRSRARGRRSSPRSARSPPGSAAVTLKIPKKTKSGKVTVAITLKGTTGSTQSYKVTRTVKLPKP